MPASSRSQRGAEGGYWLARPAAEMTLADVIRAVDGPLANVRGDPLGAGRATQGARRRCASVDRGAREPARRARAGDARRPCERRAAGVACRSWPPTPTPGRRTEPPRPLGERRFARRARRRRSGPASSSSRSASSRVSCTAKRSPSSRTSSTRTSKPRWTTRSTIASRVDPFGVRRTLEVVRAHQRVAERGSPGRRTTSRTRSRALVQLARAGDLLDPAVVHHHDLVGDLHRLLLVVRDDHRRRVRLVVQPAQPQRAARCAPARRARRTARRAAAPSARRRARGRAPCAAAGRPRAAPG